MLFHEPRFDNEGMPVSVRIFSRVLSLVVLMSGSQEQISEKNVRPSVRHGRLNRAGSWRNAIKVGLAGLAVVAVSAVSVGAYAAWDVNNSRKDSVTLVKPDADKIGNTDVAQAGAVEGSLSIFLAGSDSRSGQELDDGEEGELNDVNMLLTVSADHTKASITSFPRDLMLPIPSCPSAQGEPNYYPAMSEQPLNSTLQYGGLACAALTIQKLTGVEIDYAGLISFDGVIDLTNAIGGVNVCVATPINDPMSGLQLDQGEHTLQGLDALQFLRSRYGVGDGGDLSRISNQQQFMSNLVKKIKSEDTLSNPAKIYNLAKATAENVTLSDSLNSVPQLLSVAATIKDINLEDINFYQYPVKTHPYNPNKVAPDYATAKLLFEAIQSGQSLQVAETGPATEVESSATPGAPAVTDEPQSAQGPQTTQDVPTSAPAQEAQAGETPAPTASESPLENLRGQNASEVTCTTGR